MGPRTVIDKHSMRVFDPYGEIEITKPMTMTTSSLRDRVACADYVGYYHSIGGREARSEFVEYMPRMPIMVDEFYRAVVELGTIPMPEQAADRYIDAACVDLGRGYLALCNDPQRTPFDEMALRGRLARAYPSWVREIDLLLQLHDQAPSAFEATYDSLLDHAGTDILVSHGENRYSIASYVGTRSSELHRQAKKSMHGQKDIPQLEVVSSRFNGDQVGDLTLHSASDVSKVLNRIIDLDRHRFSPTLESAAADLAAHPSVFASRTTPHHPHQPPSR